MKKTRTLVLDQLSKLRNQQGAGFTLIELMIVIAILGTLAAIALPVYSHQIEKAKITKAIVEISMLQKAIMIYQIDPGSGVAEEEETPVAVKKKVKGTGKATVPATATNDLPDSLADIGYENLLDPWGSPYQFANHANITPGQRRKYMSTVPLNTDYDLYSMGPDGNTAAPITAKAGYDDIIRASDGEYIGPASQF